MSTTDQTPSSADPEQLAGQSADNPRGGLVVVNTDGSPAAAAALDWAAHEADRIAGHLLVVHAYQRPGVGHGLSDPVLVARRRHEAELLLDRAASQLGRHWPALPISTLLFEGDPVEALHRESVSSRLTVLGADDGHRVAHALLGSAALSTSSGHSSPIVLVHAHDRYRTSGRVVVGVDDTDASVSATLFAADLADELGTGLIMVQATGDAPATRSTGFSSKVTRCARRHPALRIWQQVRPGHPTDVLTDAGTGERLMVVGTRGRRGLAGLHPDSTSQDLIVNAGIPIVVVPPGSVS